MNYGNNISDEVLQEIAKSPMGDCEVCKKYCLLNTDHDHKTGEFRGRLCHDCNLVLGHVEDSTERLKALIVYLEERHEKTG